MSFWAEIINSQKGGQLYWTDCWLTGIEQTKNGSWIIFELVFGPAAVLGLGLFPSLFGAEAQTILSPCCKFMKVMCHLLRVICHVLLLDLLSLSCDMSVFNYFISVSESLSCLLSFVICQLDLSIIWIICEKTFWLSIVALVKIWPVVCLSIMDVFTINLNCCFHFLNCQFQELICIRNQFISGPKCIELLSFVSLLMSRLGHQSC